MISLSNRSKLNILHNLGTLLSAGIPIIDSVDSLLEEFKGNEKKVLKILKADLNQGKTMADSFEKLGDCFDKVTINLIRASEQAGTLETTLKDLTTNIKKDIEFMDKVKASLAYPILVTITFFAVLLLILIFVIPRIGDVFTRLHAELPIQTKILIALSSFIHNYSLLALGLAVLIAVGVFFLYKTQRRALLNVFYHLPLLSSVATNIDLTRFTRNMALMLTSGIPLVEALALSSNVVFKNEVNNVIKHAKEKVTSGGKLADGLRDKHKIAPSVMILLVEAGEKSGTLDKSMQELTDYFEDAVQNQLKTLTTLLEPIMLIIIAVLIGGMMMSIIAPIYQLIGNIRGR